MTTLGTNVIVGGGGGVTDHGDLAGLTDDDHTQYITDLVKDTTPQLGGTLDMQANTLAGNGGTTGITISANGEVSMTSQPAFAAYNSVTDSDKTGNGSPFTVDLDTEVYDQNADFATDTFTAPVTGRYLITGYVRYDGATSAATFGQITFTASNRNWSAIFNIDGGTSIGGHIRTAVIDMDAADTLTLVFQVDGEASDVIDIFGGANPQTSFSGVLVA